MSRKYRLGALFGALSVIMGAPASAAPKTTYVLVHGAWMGKAAWDPVAQRLRHQGAEVVLQQVMLANTPVKEVVTLDSSHVPMLTRPGEVAKILLRFAKE